jgi:uncharacterized membrane protein YqjE
MSQTIHTKTPETVTSDGHRTGPGAPDTRSVAELVQDMSEQMSRLIRDELRLAQAELAEKGKRAGIGAGLFGGAGLIALYGLAGLFTTIVLGLVAAGLPAWAAALIVTAALFVVSGVMAVIGRSQVTQIGSPMPEQAVQSIKDDVHEVKERAHR